MKKDITIVLAATAVLLAVPFLFGAAWTKIDFLTAGFLIFTSGLLYTFIKRKIDDKKRSFYLISFLGLLFLYVWIEMAVGVFTDFGN